MYIYGYFIKFIVFIWFNLMGIGFLGIVFDYGIVIGFIRLDIFGDSDYMCIVCLSVFMCVIIVFWYIMVVVVIIVYEYFSVC